MLCSGPAQSPGTHKIAPRLTLLYTVLIYITLRLISHAYLTEHAHAFFIKRPVYPPPPRLVGEEKKVQSMSNLHL